MGADDFRNDLGTRRAKEERLRTGIHAGVLHRHEDVAHLVADGSATGLAGGENFVTGLTQKIGQGSHLAGLAASIGSFKCDEHKSLRPPYSRKILTRRLGSLP